MSREWPFPRQTNHLGATAQRERAKQYVPIGDGPGMGRTRTSDRADRRRERVSSLGGTVTSEAGRCVANLGAGAADPTYDYGKDWDKCPRH